ncbi:FLYWCH-type zinc finger-containing protein 1-like, partial [Anneissia japonica]|uniref:FLYWCH-type zinc finger-containing protein 1-like n=1 Tax=Anneissia japonica TaxID=1529436 RepID=UPI0014255169
MEVIVSNKGGRKLCHEGFMYTVQKSTTSHIFWRCVERMNGCRSRLMTDLAVIEPNIASDHNHQPDQIAFNVAKARAVMKGRAVQTNDNPARIFSESIQELDQLTKMHMPKESTCKRTIRNQRSHEYPPEPNTLRDLVIEMDVEWSKTR